MSYAIELKNLVKSYSDFTLDQISLKVPTGCIVGFIGENGAGKSTTMKLILDLIKKDSGEILLLGKPNNQGTKQLKEEIGVVLDECCFPDNITVPQVDKILKCTYQTWDSSAFSSYCSRFSLPTDKVVKDFSRGMKMKLSIAVALSHHSKLLILDEATSGLDPLVRDEILDIFLEFIQDDTHSIFISSHILSDLEKICDYIAFLHKGKLIFCEEKDQLLEQYGLLKCSKEEFQTIPSCAIKGIRENRFGMEALVLKDQIPSSFVVDRINIEDIMLFMGKENLS